MKDTFDYPVGLSEKVNLNSLGLAPKMIYSASSDMLVENVHNYGFSYGIYPSNAGSGKQIVFATPDLHYFQIRNVANTTNTSNSNSFTFEISSNGTDWTSFTDFTKGNVLPGTGTESVWAQRDYTSNSADSFPKGGQISCV